MATAARALILICAVQIAEPLSAAEQAIIDLAAAMPGFLEVVWQLAAVLLGTWAVTIVVAGLVQRRGALLLDVAMGMAPRHALWWWVDDRSATFEALVVFRCCCRSVRSPWGVPGPTSAARSSASGGGSSSPLRLRWCCSPRRRRPVPSSPC